MSATSQYLTTRPFCNASSTEGARQDCPENHDCTLTFCDWLAREYPHLCPKGCLECLEVDWFKLAWSCISVLRVVRILYHACVAPNSGSKHGSLRPNPIATKVGSRVHHGFRTLIPSLKKKKEEGATNTAQAKKAATTELHADQGQ